MSAKERISAGVEEHEYVLLRVDSGLLDKEAAEYSRSMMMSAMQLSSELRMRGCAYFWAFF